MVLMRGGRVVEYTVVRGNRVVVYTVVRGDRVGVYNVVRRGRIVENAISREDVYVVTGLLNTVVGRYVVATLGLTFF